MVPAAAFDPLLILLAALALDAALGELRPVFRFVPHPVAAIGHAIGWFERRLNRADRPPSDRRLRGVVTVAAVVLGAALLGYLLLHLTRRVAWGWAVEIAVAALLVAQRSLFDHVLAVARGLESGGVEGGRTAVRHIVGRDPESLDAHGVARAAIESLFENLSDAVVAPVFWYLVAGLPGLLAYKALNTCDSMLGHRSERYAEFGFAAARADTAANWIPARLTGALVVLAARFAPGTSTAAAWRTMWRDARRHRSVNAGWPEAAAAGALGLALAGPRRYGGAAVNDAWMGDGRARATPADIRRALLLYVVACVVHAGLLIALVLLRRF